jgi:superfamily II DNA or RNA helicase
MSIQDNIDNIILRDVFEEGYMNIYNRLENDIKGDTLVHATCGVGKSRFIYKTILTHFLMYDDSLVIAVFPTIALITQFNSDYISNDLGKNLFKVLSVCSRNELDKTKCKEVSFTTDPKEIYSFVNTKGQKLVCCTYQSLTNFADSLGETKVDYCFFDEAHHTDSPITSKLINDDNCFYENAMFLTATPSKSMKERLERISYVPYSLALEKGYVKEFEVRIDIGRKPKITKNKNILAYESIARTILATGSNKAMSFHSYSNPVEEQKAKTSVKHFAKEKLFKQSFEKILKTEFPHLSGKYKKITLKGCTADTKNRERLLRNFDSTKDNEIFVLCSCKTIGEGVDTRTANMSVFVDPKQSWKDIMQNIGRCIRKNGNEIATVLLMVLTDYEPYEDCKTLEEKDDVLRTQINQSGDFNTVLNVCSALKQSGEVEFENCLLYPKKYKDDSNNNNNIDQKYNVNGDEEGDSDESDIDEKHKEDDDKDDSNEADIDEKHKEDDDKDDSDEVDIDEKHKDDDDNSKRKKKVNRKGIKINIHTDPEFQVLWGIKDDQVFNNIIKSSVIDCIVQSSLTLDDLWNEHYQNVLEYLKKNNNKLPSRKR